MQRGHHARAAPSTSASLESLCTSQRLLWTLRMSLRPSTMLAALLLPQGETLQEHQMHEHVASLSLSTLYLLQFVERIIGHIDRHMAIKSDEMLDQDLNVLIHPLPNPELGVEAVVIVIL